VGIGFVLFFWALILGVIAMPFSIALGLWSWWNERRAHRRGWVFKAVVAAALPFILLAYAGAAFGVYAIWCEAVRNVDAGIGDGCRVPVTNDYYFCMIDVPLDNLKVACHDGSHLGCLKEALRWQGPTLTSSTFHKGRST
jgi:ABC-type dipeptide/oligopeptide/nickel transport system permease component